MAVPRYLFESVNITLVSFRLKILLEHAYLKNCLCIAELGRFSPCSSVVYVKCTPSSHDENRLKLCDSVGNIYY